MTSGFAQPEPLSAGEGPRLDPSAPKLLFLDGAVLRDGAMVAGGAGWMASGAATSGHAGAAVVPAHRAPGATPRTAA